MRTLTLSTVLLLLGAAQAQPALLHELASPNAFVDGFFGASVSGLDDVDGDGRGDLLVGAWNENDPTQPAGGRAYVFSGATGALAYELVSPNGQEDGYFGGAVSGAPDLDGDGVADLLVGASGELASTGASYAGRAYVFSGASGALLYEIESPLAEFGGYFGSSVSGLEDVDGDGRGDIAVGALWEDLGTSAESAGRAYVFSGMTGTLLYTLVSPNPEDYGAFGTAVSGMDDVDGDGVPDLVVGAPYEESCIWGEGMAYVFSGASGTLLYERASPSCADFSLGEFGASVSGTGDLDGDGVGDLLIGAPLEGGWTDGGWPDRGRAYTFSGATGAALHQFVSPYDEEETFISFGSSVSGLGDVDGDGRADLLIGAMRDDGGTGLTDVGRAYVFSGASGVLLHELASPNEEEGGRLGASVSGVPDVDGDGRTDFLVGAYLEEPGTSPEDAGRAYVFSGAATPPAITVTLDPHEPPVTLPAGGGVFSFAVTLTNAGPDVETADVWAEVSTPSGQTLLMSGPGTVAVPGQGSASREAAQRVPASAEAGSYTYAAYVGTYPEAVASDTFTFTKEEALGRAGEGADAVEAWALVYAGEWAPIEAGDARGADAPAVQARVVGRAPPSVLSAWPNPLSSRTTLTFEPVEAGHVRLSVYDVLGREVARLVDGELPAGRREVVFNGSRLPAGTYLVRLVAGPFVQTTRLTLAR